MASQFVELVHATPLIEPFGASGFDVETAVHSAEALSGLHFSGLRNMP